MSKARAQMLKLRPLSVFQPLREHVREAVVTESGRLPGLS